jgi:hypothetical protein
VNSKIIFLTWRAAKSRGQLSIEDAFFAHAETNQRKDFLRNFKNEKMALNLYSKKDALEKRFPSSGQTDASEKA